MTTKHCLLLFKSYEIHNKNTNSAYLKACVVNQYQGLISQVGEKLLFFYYTTSLGRVIQSQASAERCHLMFQSLNTCVTSSGITIAMHNEKVTFKDQIYFMVAIKYRPDLLWCAVILGGIQIPYMYVMLHWYLQNPANVLPSLVFIYACVYFIHHRKQSVQSRVYLCICLLGPGYKMT